MSAVAPRNVLNALAIQSTGLRRAVDYLQNNGHAVAATAVRERFLGTGEPCFCGFSGVMAPCQAMVIDRSGGWCRSCGHNRGCHSPRKLAEARHRHAGRVAEIRSKDSNAAVVLPEAFREGWLARAWASLRARMSALVARRDEA